MAIFYFMFQYILSTLSVIFCYSLAVDYLDVEDQVRVSWDVWLGGSSVCGGRWASNIGLGSYGHLWKGILPALDHLHFSDVESDWVASY